MGFLCTADPDIKYGLFVEGENLTAGSSQLEPQYAAFAGYCQEASKNPDATFGYTVLTTAGSKQKGADAAKKDADGNYWLINKANGFLQGIYTVPVNYGSKSIQFKSKFSWTKCVPFNMPKSSKEGSIETSDIKGRDILYGTTETFGDREVWDFSGPGGTSQFMDTKFTITNHKFSSVSNVKGSDAVYLKITGTGYWFQSDYNGSSNKWIPVGIMDQGGRTAHVYDYAPVNTTTGGTANQAYSVYPTDEYFLNCYLGKP